jgi:uncharacterized protein (DUF736 family)
MNIGSFKSVNGQLLGSVATATIDLARLGLRPVESNNERAPAFEIMVLNVAKRWVQIGALWEMTSNSSGESFYQGKLDGSRTGRRSRTNNADDFAGNATADGRVSDDQTADDYVPAF